MQGLKIGGIFPSTNSAANPAGLPPSTALSAEGAVREQRKERSDAGAPSMTCEAVTI